MIIYIQYWADNAVQEHYTLEGEVSCYEKSQRKGW